MTRAAKTVLSTFLATSMLVAACTSDNSSQTNGIQSERVERSSGSTFEAGPVVEPVFDNTPIELDSDVRTGVLDNGLTYYVRSNDAPGGSLSLRLAVDAGSLLQDQSESGAAHFLEHMMFNGTEQFPGNELARALESIGVQFGADLNAYTSFDETVYQLDINSVDDDKVDTGFDVLAQWASAATIEEDATIDERGVVREEIRLRDEGADGAIQAVFDDLYLAGSAYEGHEPGGRADLILATEPDQLRTFYERWYRPDLMAIIAVGDLPVDELEAKIVERFAELEPRGDSPERPRPTIDLISEPKAQVFSHPEATEKYVSIDYSIPTWDANAVGGERLNIVQSLYGSMINARLLDAVDRGDADLDHPFAGTFPNNRVQKFLGFNYDAPDLLVGAEYVLTEMETLKRNGFTEAELARATDQLQSSLDQYLAGASTTQDAQYADGYVSHFLGEAEASSIESLHKRWSDVLEDLTAEEVSNVFRWDMSQSAPIVLLVSPDEEALPGVEAIEEAIERAANSTGNGNNQDDSEAVQSLIDRPAAEEPVETNNLGEVNATEWVFANGATVRFRWSSISANSVNLWAEAQGGWSLLDPEDAALAQYANDAVADSSRADFDRVSYRRYLSTTTATIAPYIDETTEGFFGSSSTDDLESLFQQLHLAVTAPKVDTVALEDVVDNADALSRRIATEASFAATNELDRIIFDDDPRFLYQPPNLDDLTEQRALDIYQERLSTVDDLVIAITGDVSEETVKELADHYIGTLPAGEADQGIDIRPPQPTGVVKEEIEAGSGEATGIVAVRYPTDHPVNATVRIELVVLSQILDGRLLDVIREELGATYGASVGATVREGPIEGVDLDIFATIDPDRSQEVLDVIAREVDDLVENGPTTEEFNRATSVLEADYELIGNGTFLEQLHAIPDEDPITYDSRLALLAAVDKADIQEFIADLTGGLTVGVVVEPAG